MWNNVQRPILGLNFSEIFNFCDHNSWPFRCVLSFSHWFHLEVF